MSRKNSTNWSVDDDIAAARLQDLNEDLDDIYIYGDDRGRLSHAASGTPLKLDVGAFAWRVGSVHGQFAGATDVTVTDEATNYIEIDESNTIQINQSGWTTENGRLGIAVATGGAITSISIWKPDVVGGVLGTQTLVNVETLSATRTLISTDKIFQYLNPNGADRTVDLDRTNMSEGQQFVIQNTANTYDLDIEDNSVVLRRIRPKESVHATFDGTEWKLTLDTPESLINHFPSLNGQDFFAGVYSPATLATVSYYGSITFDAASSGGTSVSHTIGSGNNRVLVVVAGVSGNTGTVSNIQYGGVAMTTLANGSDNGRNHGIYIMFDPPVGTANITGSVTGSGSLQILGASYFGVASYESLANIYQASGTTKTYGTTSTSDGILRVGGAMSLASAATYTASTGASARIGSGSSPTFFDSGSQITPAGAFTMNVTVNTSTSTWGRAVSLIPVARGAVRVATFAQSVKSTIFSQIAIPNYIREGKFKARFVWSTTSASGNNAIWGIKAMSVPDNTTHATDYGTPQTVTDANNGADKINISAETPEITIGGTPARNQPCYFEIYRSGDTDNLAATVRLHSVILRFL